MRALEIPAHEPSTFLTVARGAGFWRGPLPRLSVNDAFLEGLGGERPKESLLLPILLRSKVVAYLYGDNLDHSVEGVPFPELQRLVTKAGLAFEVHVLRNKIRNA